jgi:hypothetical protein
VRGHSSDPASFDSDDAGFFTAVCSCGWKQGPLPDVETMVDALMQHAFEMGIRMHVTESGSTT